MNALSLIRLCILVNVVSLSCIPMQIKTNISNANFYAAFIYLSSYEHAQLVHLAMTGRLGKFSDLEFDAPSDSKFIKYYEITEGVFCAELIDDIDGCKKGAKLFTQVTISGESKLRTDDSCLNKKLADYIIKTTD